MKDLGCGIISYCCGFISADINEDVRIDRLLICYL